MQREKISVCVRLRPLNDKEVARKEREVIFMEGDRVDVDLRNVSKINRGYLKNQNPFQNFYYEKCFNKNQTNESIHGDLTKKMVLASLKGINSTVFVYGQTGSGKTSIINLISRFYDPTSGRVLLNGMDIKKMSTMDLRTKMALVMQEPFLFSETIRNNITLGNPHISEEAMEQILKDSNCKTFIDRLPDGIDTVLSEGGASISSGERQLISIARAIARNPDLIILDEATSYIDSETEHNIQEALVNLMVNRTSIVVAHRLSTARDADRIIVLSRGQIIETGAHAELMQQKGFYYRLNQLQS